MNLYSLKTSLLSSLKPVKYNFFNTHNNGYHLYHTKSIIDILLRDLHTLTYSIPTLLTKQTLLLSPPYIFGSIGNKIVRP